jgi:hypothetical protein
MRRLRLLGSFAAVLLAMGLQSAHASLPGLAANGADPVFRFDESGRGTADLSDLGGGFVGFPGVLAPDPSNGGLLALTYFLPALWVAQNISNGDVTVFETPNGVISDGLRFTNADGSLTGASADRMIYYSDPGTPTDLADGIFGGFGGFLPNNWNTGNFASVNEVGPEGNNGFNYLNGIYLGVSDTPEPSSLAIAGLGALGLFVYGLRRRAKT